MADPIKDDWPQALERLKHTEPHPDQGIACVGTADLEMALERLHQFAEVALGNAVEVSRLTAALWAAEARAVAAEEIVRRLVNASPALIVKAIRAPQDEGGLEEWTAAVTDARALSALQGRQEGEGDLLPGRFEDAPADVTLWGVYGPDCFLTVFCCRLKDYWDGSRAVWGHSFYAGEPGFRTLGTGAAWAEENNLRLFDTRAEALRYVDATISAPRATASPTPDTGSEEGSNHE